MAAGDAPGFPAFLDTCALFSQYLCDTLLSIAEQGAFTPFWSAEVLEAVERNVIEKTSAQPESVRRRIEAMQRAFPHSMVDEYDFLVPAMTNHPDDRHVLAACISSPADTIVTFNLKDFPPHALEPHDVTVTHPDEFLLDQLDLHPQMTMRGLQRMLARNRQPPQDFNSLANRLAVCGASQFAHALRSLDWER